MKREPYTDDATIRAVRKAYFSGWTMMRIVGRYAVTETTIRRWRTRYGWPMRQTQPTGKRRRSLVPVEQVPRQWRCEDCGLNVGVPCRCGKTPPWAA